MVGHAEGRAWRFAACAGAAVVGALAVPAAAAAHVTVHPATVAPRSQDAELTFRVPNERDDANTVSVQVFLPATVPLSIVDVQPVTGWRAAGGAGELAWTATAGGIAPGQYQDFSVSLGSVPAGPASLVFKALQTYSSGDVVRWIDVPAAGQPAPAHPAPVVTVGDDATAPASARGVEPGTDAVAVAALVLSALSVAGVTWLLWARRRHP